MASVVGFLMMVVVQARRTLLAQLPPMCLRLWLNRWLLRIASLQESPKSRVSSFPKMSFILSHSLRPDITIPQPIPGYVPIGYATRKEYLESGERDSILDNPVGHNWYDEFEADDIRLKNDPRFPGMIFEHPDLDSHYGKFHPTTSLPSLIYFADSLGIKASSYDHEVASSTQAPAKIEHAHQIQTEYLHHTQVEELRLVQNKHVSHVYPEQVHHAQKRHVSHIPTIHHIQNEHVSHIPTGHVPHIQNKTVTPSHAEKTPHIPTKSFSIISYDADLSDTSDESEDEDAMEARLQEMKFAQIEACRAETAARQQRKAERQLEEKLLAITAASRCSSLGLISGDGYESDDASQQSFLSHDRLSDIASQTSFTASVVNTNFDKPSHQLTSGLDKNDDNVAITTEPESIFIQEYDGTTVATFSDCQPTQFDENSVTAVEHLSPHQSIVADQIDDYATEPVDPVCYLPDLAFDIPKDSVRSNPGTADLEDSILDLQYQIVKKRKAAIRVLKKRVAKEASDNNGFESYFADVKESAPEPKLVTLWNLKTDSSFKNGAGTSTGPSIFGPAIVKDDTTEDAVLPEAADDPTKDITHDQVTATYQDGANSDLPDDAFDVADAVFNNIPVADDSHRMTYGLTDLAYNPAAAKIVASSDNKRDNLWLGNAVYEPTKYQNYVKVGSSHGFGGSQLSPYGFQSTASDHADDFAQFFGSGPSSPTNAATTSLDIRDILGIKHESKEAPEIGSHFASANSLVPASAPVPGPVPAPVPGPVPASLSSAPTITTSAASEKPVRLENHIVKMIDVKGFPGQFKGRMTAAQYTRSESSHFALIVA